MLDGIRIETSPYLPAGAWVALDKDRNPIAFGAAAEDFVIVPQSLHTIVCATDLKVNLDAVVK